jgi:ATP-dependent Zn protease
MKSSIKTLIFYVVFIVAIFGISAYLLGTEPDEKIVYSDIIQHFKNEEVAEFNISSTNVLEMKLKDEKKVEFRLKYVDLLWRT